MRVGFIGLGKMGRPMAARLLAAGYSLVVHNRSQTPVEALVAEGARPAASPAEAVAQSDVVLTCVTNTQSVEAVYEGSNGLLEAARPGLIFVDHSTVSPETNQRIAAKAAAAGAALLDAPVSGGVPGAERGALTIMVGGDPEAFETVAPILHVLGSQVRHIGPSGSGSVVKLANQLMVAVNLAGVFEALVLVMRAGVDPAAAIDLLRTSFGGSRMLDRTGPMLLERDFAVRTPVDLIVKDLAVVEDLAARLKVRTLTAAMAYQVFLEAQAAGFGPEDMVAAVKPLERLAGVEVRGKPLA